MGAAAAGIASLVPPALCWVPVTHSCNKHLLFPAIRHIPELGNPPWLWVRRESPRGAAGLPSLGTASSSPWRGGRLRGAHPAPLPSPALRPSATAQLTQIMCRDELNAPRGISQSRTDQVVSSKCPQLCVLRLPCPSVCLFLMRFNGLGVGAAI